MKWETVRLGDIIDFSNGINFDKSAYTQGIKIVGVSDFGNLFSPNYDELSEVKSDIVKTKDLLKNGDIVFVRSNGNKELVGRCMLVKKLPYPVTYSGFCIRARINNPNSYNSVFLTYYFKSMFFRKLLSGSSVGANIQNLSQARLSNCTISIPHIQTQKRIADILSAYDDLIENNQKQIKLLEEAAQRLYKECFVVLRFPGHEHTAIVDGVPEGWIKCVVTDLLDIKYGKDHKFLNDGNIPVYGSGGIMRKVEPILYSGESVLIPRKGSLNNILYVSGDFWTIDTMFYSVPKRLNIAKYVYLFLSQLDMYSFNTGAAVPSMTVKILESIDTILPSETVINAFNDVVSPLFNRIQLLQEQSEKSKQARDRLLPKLMSGEMEV